MNRPFIPHINPDNIIRRDGEISGWTSSPACQAALRTIEDNLELIEERLTPGTWIEGGGRTYYRSDDSAVGGAIAILRRNHALWIERQFARMDARFAVDGSWDQGRSDALFRASDTDAMIAALMVQAKRKVSA